MIGNAEARSHADVKLAAEREADAWTNLHNRLAAGTLNRAGGSREQTVLERKAIDFKRSDYHGGVVAGAPQCVVDAEMVVHRSAGVIAVAGNRNPLGNLRLQVGVRRQLERVQERRLKRDVTRAETLVKVAGQNVCPELERPLHQLAIQEQGLGAHIDIAEIGSGIIHIRFDAAVGHLDKHAEVARSDFLVERQLVIIDRVFDLGRPFTADLGPEELGGIREMVSDAVVPANARGRDWAGAVLEKGGVRFVEPARLVAWISAADAIVDAANEPSPARVIIAPAAVLPAGHGLAVGAASAAAE